MNSKSLLKVFRFESYDDYLKNCHYGQERNPNIIIEVFTVYNTSKHANLITGEQATFQVSICAFL